MAIDVFYLTLNGKKLEPSLEATLRQLLLERLR
jgi:hypothetical protein